MSRGKNWYHKLTLGKVVPVLKGRTYLFGGNGAYPNEPFDCFGMIVEYIKLSYNVDLLVLHSDRGYDFFEYANKLEPEVMALFERYLSESFLPVVPSYKVPGDILWCEADGKGTSGIYLGNKLMLITSPETDCDIIQTTYYDIKDVYRWPQLSQ